MDFKLVSDYKPTGDQPEAIEQLVSSLRGHSRHNTLLGVTGSGKTFTMANVIVLLRLYPTGSLFADDRYLHRKGPVDQRGDREDAPEHDFVPAERA